jgi:hypothetical protein
MEALFVCPECRAEHAEPADARLGHFIICLDCVTEAAGREIFVLTQVAA